MFKKTDFSEAYLRNVSVKGTQINKTDFTDSTLIDVNLSQAHVIEIYY
ncbi:pentapeptide repeat-containing protein, partial [Crocosphaera watsonii]